MQLQITNCGYYPGNTIFGEVDSIAIFFWIMHAHAATGLPVYVATGLSEESK